MTKKTVCVSPLRKGHDKPILDVFVQPKLIHVTIGKDGSRKKTGNPVNQYKALFYKDETLSSRVFVQGEPGMGKTTFLTKLALDWCDAVSDHNPDPRPTFSDVETLTEFRFLFPISLRDANDQREVIEMIKTQIIHRIYDGDKREETVKLLPHILERETCIITMDGLNEWVDRLNQFVIPLFAQWHSNCISVITSRPWKMADERIRDSEISNLIEIEGIIDTEDLANKIINSLQTGNVKTTPKFMKYVNERQFGNLLTSPLLQTLLVNLWINKLKFSGSLCEINCILLDLLFKNARAKRGYFQNVNMFQCLTNTSFIQRQINIFDALANVAFNFTFSSSKSIVFTEREILNHMSEEQLEFCLHAGVLTKRNSLNITDQDAQFSFLHETLQEFMAAYHIANSKQDLIKQFRTGSKYNVLEMSQTIIYLCGLDCKLANELINCLVDDEFLKDISHGLSGYIKGLYKQEQLLAYQEDSCTQKNCVKSKINQKDYNARCFAQSVLFQRMITAGCIEAKASGEKEICLNCRDFTFNKSLTESDSNALKRLLLYNNSDVRSLIVESNFLPISEILTVIHQSKHCLTRVKLTMTPEISKAIHHTSIKELHCVGNFDVSSFSCVLPSLSQLTYLRIEDTILLQDIALPETIQHIHLSKCELSSEWLCSLLITLSSLDHPVKCELWDFVLQSGEGTRDKSHTPISARKMSNIHISVTNGSKELFELLCDTSIGMLDLRTADCASLASEILHTLNRLTKLNLWGTYTGRCDLKLPASLECISLKEGGCSYEWVFSLLITLSSLDHPVKCELLDVVWQSSEEARGDEYNKRISGLRSEILLHDLSNIEILAKNGSAELYELIRDTSIESLIITATDSCTLETVMQTQLSMLKKIYLLGTYLTHFEYDLPQSLELVYLQGVKCSLECFYSVLIKLSTIRHHVRLDMDCVVISSNETCLPSSNDYVIQSECLKYVKADVNSSNTNVSDLQSEMLPCDMSNIELRILKFHKERLEILRGTNIRSVQFQAFDDVSVTYVTQNTLPAFKEIRLQGTYMTDFNHKLPPTLQLMILQEGSCSSNLLYSVLIQLSTLSHTVRFFLDEYVVLQRRESIEKYPVPLMRGVDLSNVKLEVFKDCPGLYETLPTMNITSLNMTRIEHTDLLSQALPLLTHLQQLRICLNKYDMEMKLPECIKYVFIIYKKVSPSSLQHFVQNLSTTKHSVQCKLLFRMDDNEDEYTRIKQDFCEVKSINVQQFEVVNKKGTVRRAAALTLSATADDCDDDYDKHLLRWEGVYVDSKPWIHYCKIRLNILYTDACSVSF